MEFLLKREAGVRRLDGEGALIPFRADLLVRDGSMVAVVNLRRCGEEWVAETSITVQREGGEIDLVGYVLQPVPEGDGEALAYFQDSWLSLRKVFENAPAGLSIKEVLRPLDQSEISALGTLHLAHHELDVPGDQGVLPKTARMWRLLQQFGSFRPAEVIANLLGEKVPTIHARINLSREQGLIPPAERMKRRTQRQNED